jgi:hypothetical protein
MNLPSAPMATRVVILAALSITLGWLVTNRSTDRHYNGFHVTHSLLPASEIVPGGPPRDAIPALTDPAHVDADAAARWLSPQDRVLGLSLEGSASAYPVAIMSWHEVVNDRLGETPVLVTYCPLCGTGMAFYSRAGGEVRRFGVSGLLYNSNLLLYDRQTESLWSQALGQAVTGPLRGTRLEPLPLTHTTWSAWLAEHPHTRVLSRATGHDRDYDQDPYLDYREKRGVFFPLSHQDERYPPKTWVLGVEVGEAVRAYPFPELAAVGGEVVDTLGGTTVRVVLDAEHQSARAMDGEGRGLPAVMAYWFAWAAFHPETDVFTARDR